MPNMQDMMNPVMNQGMNMNPNMQIGNPGMMGQNIPNMPIDPTAGMSVYQPRGSGTKLTDLLNGNGNDNDSVASNHSTGSAGYQVRGPMMGHTQYPGQQFYQQQDPYNRPRPGRRPNQISHDDGSCDTERSRDSESDYSDIKRLAREVNSSLEALESIEYNKKKKRHQDTESEEDEDVEIDADSIVVDTVEQQTDYLKVVTEFLILLTLYVILSQPFIVSFASNYITQLNPDENGVVSLTGVIIYGMILTVMFMVLRKVIFNRMA